MSGVFRGVKAWSLCAPLFSRAGRHRLLILRERKTNPCIVNSFPPFPPSRVTSPLPVCRKRSMALAACKSSAVIVVIRLRESL